MTGASFGGIFTLLLGVCVLADWPLRISQFLTVSLATPSFRPMTACVLALDSTFSAFASQRDCSFGSNAATYGSLPVPVIRSINADGDNNQDIPDSFLCLANHQVLPLEMYTV